MLYKENGRILKMTTQAQEINAQSSSADVQDAVLQEVKSPNLKIEIEDDEGNKAIYTMMNKEISIGRGNENHIRLTQRNVSREHLRLALQDDGMSVVVKDLESYTGVYHNGRKIQEHCILRVGEYLNVGEYMIALKQDTPSQGKSKVEVEYIPFDEQAKLVVVSSNLAGKTFQLDRKELMIGRTDDENDLVVNHRSISRTHAKIIYRQNEFVLLDMGSSNGVTINGEPFVKTAPLRNGDLIVMGMVKFRFVAPGDHYTFNAKDIDDQNLDQPQTHRDLLFIVLLLLIALISAWLVSKFLFKKNHQPIPTTIEQNQQNQPMPPAELDPADENGQEVIKPLENKAESENQKMDANLNGEDAPEGKAGETPEEKNDEKPKDQPE